MGVFLKTHESLIIKKTYKFCEIGKEIMILVLLHFTLYFISLDVNRIILLSNLQMIRQKYTKLILFNVKLNGFL